MTTASKKNGHQNGSRIPELAPDPTSNAAAFGSEVAGMIAIAKPKFEVAEFRISGTAPYVQLRFGEKAKNMMIAKQQAGDAGKSRKKRDPRDFESDFKGATHHFPDGRYGIPATSFKNAMVAVCRVAGVQMVRAKMLVHVLADGHDPRSGDPLVGIFADPECKTAPVPVSITSPVRNATGVADLRVRAKFDPWYAMVRVRYDASAILGLDVLALMIRCGIQIGIGEGRPFVAKTTNSSGMGWGTFDVELLRHGS